MAGEAKSEDNAVKMGGRRRRQKGCGGGCGGLRWRRQHRRGTRRYFARMGITLKGRRIGLREDGHAAPGRLDGRLGGGDGGAGLSGGALAWRGPRRRAAGWAFEMDAMAPKANEVA